MPGKSERSKVEVKETSTVDSRSFTITLTAPINDFQLTDLLKQRGVISGLEVYLKHAVRQATDNYLKSAEALISGLACKPSSPKQPQLNSNGNAESVKAIPSR
jgi:hypothetical protein